MAGAAAGAPGQMPPEDAAALASILGLGGGGLPPEAAAGMPPEAAMMGGAPAPAGPIPGFASTDPASYVALQQQDIATLQAAQAAAAQQATSMTTAAGAMGGPAAPPGVPPLGGDPFGGPPLAAPMGDPMMGSVAPPMPMDAQAFGGPDYGGMESESVGTLPGGEFADDLGLY